jgi:hypothetical protein
MRTILFAVEFDRQVSDGADHDECGGGRSVPLKLHDTGRCRINDFCSASLLQ